VIERFDMDGHRPSAFYGSCLSRKARSTMLLVLVACLCLWFFEFWTDLDAVGTRSTSTSTSTSTGTGTGTQRVLSYRDFAAEVKGSASSSSKDLKQIPKLLFRTSPFPLSKVPPEVRRVLDSAVANRNADYRLVYLDDSDAHQFLRDLYPHYLPAYASLTVGLYRADILRLLLLFHYGGVYNDIGHEYTLPLGEVFYASDEFVTVLDRNTRYHCGHAIHNAFMAAYPRHPLIKKMLDMAVGNVEREAYGDNDLDITGPIAMGKAFNQFFNRSVDALIRNGSYTVAGHHVRLLYMQKLPTSDNPNHFLFNEKAQAVASTKFPNYHAVLFVQRGAVKYGFAWRRRIVYRCSLRPTATQRHSVFSYVHCLLHHEYIRYLYMYKYDYEH
jgi:hypothetical protein